MLLEDTLGLFGLQIKQKPKAQNLSGALATDVDDDGAAQIISSNLSGAFGTYLDQDGQIKGEQEAIKKYREISLFAEVDIALQEIVNEAIPQEQDTKLVDIDLDDLKDVSNATKTKIIDEFNVVLRLLDYDERGAELFRKWYVDGRLPFQIIVDKNSTKDGIQKLVLLDAQNIKKVKEVTTKKTPEGASVIDKVDEYYLYSNQIGTAGKSSNITSASNATSLRISPDAIIFVPSGIVDQANGMVLSYLHKAIRPINQLRMLEDATVVYFIARAPERRVFYVDVGNLPKLKAEQYLKNIMNNYRNKMVYDAKDGSVKNDKKYNSLLEDFWMPRRDGGKGTEITTLQGAQNITGYLDSLGWFKDKMYESLNIPKSRLQSEGGFSIGRSTEISRDEVKFQKFIDKLRNKFGQLLIETLKTQLILKGIINIDEWEDIKPFIKLDFQKDNFFAELKNQEILQSRVTIVQSIDDYLQKYVSKEWVQKNVLMFSDEDVKDMAKQMKKEENDPSAQPQWKMQIQTQLDMAPPEEGGPPAPAPQQASPGAQTTGSEPEYNSANYKQ